jgi:selenocysteine-specific translation elongation factor
MTIKAIVICCMDFRFQKAIHELVKENGLNYGDYDLVSVKGGAGNFEQLREHLVVAKRLHNPQMIILTIHEDCGAKATQTDLEKAVVISKEIFGNDIPIIEKYLKLCCA